MEMTTLRLFNHATPFSAYARDSRGSQFSSLHKNLKADRLRYGCYSLQWRHDHMICLNEQNRDRCSFSRRDVRFRGKTTPWG